MFRVIPFLVLLPFLVVTGIARADTIYVPDDHAAIQTAIDASADGDTIIVRPGTYYENIDFNGKSVVLQAEHRLPELTVIDGQKLARVVNIWNGEDSTTVLEGFTITNGYNTWNGAGVTITNGATPRVVGNIITGNEGGEGAGIYCLGTGSDGAVIENNIIVDNIAVSDNGGGIYCENCSPLIDGNIISRNTAGNGGGIECWYGSAPTITGNIIRGNTAAVGKGGGIFCSSGGGSLIAGNWISGNTAGTQGGGIHLVASEASVLSNVITNNSAFSGGGIHCALCSPEITDNIVSGNTASGQAGGMELYNGCDSVVTNNTVVNNTSATNGGGLFMTLSVDISVENTIFWNNSAASGAEIFVGTNSAILTIDHSDVEGGQASVFVDPGGTLNWGTNMIDSDPLFIDSAHADYHLSSLSPCVDLGNSAAPNLPAEDFEGDPRSHENGPDIGADEYHRHLYVTVHTPAGGGVVPNATGEIKVIGKPNENVVVVLGRNVYDPPLWTQYGYFYLIPALFPVNSGTISADGLAVFPAVAPTYWFTGQDHPFQALVGPYNDPDSRLTNLMLIKVE